MRKKEKTIIQAAVAVNIGTWRLLEEYALDMPGNLILSHPRPDGVSLAILLLPAGDSILEELKRRARAAPENFPIFDLAERGN